jgi:hypothetical protein
LAAPQTLIDQIDQLIDYFNSRRMDLPDALFDRKTQFVINGAPFETLLSTAPNDPLVLMLARGPAGYRFTAKALQHAMPDAKIERPSTPSPQQVETTPLRTSRELTVLLTLSGTLRGSGEAINALVNVSLRLAQAGHVEIAAAQMATADLEKIQEARRRV